MPILKSKTAASLLVEVGNTSKHDVAQIWIDLLTPSVKDMSPIEVLAIAYETLQATPYRSAEQDAEGAYHINKALQEIALAMGKTPK